MKRSCRLGKAAAHPRNISSIEPRGNRYLIYGPGFQSFSAALQKSMHVIPRHENISLVLRAKAFNYTNLPNLDNPDVGPTSRVNAKGTTYTSERQWQFSLRYAF